LAADRDCHTPAGTEARAINYLWIEDRLGCHTGKSLEERERMRDRMGRVQASGPGVKIGNLSVLIPLLRGLTLPFFNQTAHPTVSGPCPLSQLWWDIIK
jgi:hypothetical protein